MDGVENKSMAEGSTKYNIPIEKLFSEPNLNFCRWYSINNAQEYFEEADKFKDRTGAHTGIYAPLFQKEVLAEAFEKTFNLDYLCSRALFKLCGEEGTSFYSFAVQLKENSEYESVEDMLFKVKDFFHNAVDRKIAKILVLYYFEDLSLEAIAYRTGDARWAIKDRIDSIKDELTNTQKPYIECLMRGLLWSGRYSADDALYTGLSERDFTYNINKALQELGLKTVYDLSRLTEEEVLAVKGIGPKSVCSIKELLGSYGLALQPECLYPSSPICIGKPNDQVVNRHDTDSNPVESIASVLSGVFDRNGSDLLEVAFNCGIYTVKEYFSAFLFIDNEIIVPVVPDWAEDLFSKETFFFVFDSVFPRLHYACTRFSHLFFAPFKMSFFDYASKIQQSGVYKAREDMLENFMEALFVEPEGWAKSYNGKIILETMFGEPRFSKDVPDEASTIKKKFHHLFVSLRNMDYRDELLSGKSVRDLRMCRQQFREKRDALKTQHKDFMSCPMKNLDYDINFLWEHSLDFRFISSSSWDNLRRVAPTIKDLISKTALDLLLAADIGNGSLCKIVNGLEEFGLSLKEDNQNKYPYTATVVGSKIFSWPIEELDLPFRVSILLEHNNIKTIADLTSKTMEDLLSIEGLGRVSLSLISDKLKEIGLAFAKNESVSPCNKEIEDRAFRKVLKIKLAEEQFCSDFGAAFKRYVNEKGVTVEHLEGYYIELANNYLNSVLSVRKGMDSAFSCLIGQDLWTTLREVADLVCDLTEDIYEFL